MALCRYEYYVLTIILKKYLNGESNLNHLGFILFGEFKRESGQVAYQQFPFEDMFEIFCTLIAFEAETTMTISKTPNTI